MRKKMNSREGLIKIMEAQQVYYGERNCDSIIKKSGAACSNGAYYSVDVNGVTVYKCGVHSKAPREKLPVNPNREQILRDKIAQEKLQVEATIQGNIANGIPGSVAVGELRMVKAPVIKVGYTAIYPNFKDKSKRVGLSFPELSPMQTGPVSYGQPGLPDATSLENFHQGNKMYDCEALHGYPTDEFYANQLAMYKDPEPNRHKKFAAIRENGTIPTKKEKPICSILVLPDKNDPSGKSIKRVGYLESRKIYCEIYERVMRDKPEYLKLADMLKNSINIQIFGFDGYDVTDKNHAECYNNADKPFGHELVLWTMLTCDPAKYPWL